MHDAASDREYEMKTGLRKGLAWFVWTVSAAMVVGTVWLAVLNGRHFAGESLPGWLDTIVAVSGLAFATVGALIVSRRNNAVGWLLAVVGFGMAVFPFAEEYALRALVTGDGLPAVQWIAWTHQWAPPLIVGAIPLLFLLFPNGHAPSRAWRPFGWVLGGGAAFAVVGTAIAAEELQGWYTHFTTPLQSPLGLTHSGEGAWMVFMVILFAMLIAAIGCVAALVTRLSRSTGEERQQLKWVAYAAVVMTVLGLAFLGVTTGVGGSAIAGKIVMVAFLLSVGFGIPASIALAIFKYRLYELDFVVKKTLMLGTLAAFISFVYVGIVVWLGSTLHGQSDNNVLVYSAAAVVAVGFQPLRSRADRLADRVVYGKRATPYDVLTDLTHRMSDAYSVQNVLPKMVEAIASATGATRIAVWIRFDAELRPGVVWPPDQHAIPVPLDVNGGLATLQGWDRVYPVVQRDELLGAITLVERPSDPIIPAKERLIMALAAQAGLVLRNVRLFEDLKASRQRLVTAQDEERRRLERNIHDGAQQRLLSLAVAVGLVRDRASDPILSAELDKVGDELSATLNELRELARGMYPAILTEAGLGPALESLVQRASVTARLASVPQGRLPAPVEATAYFVVSEALANAAKHAQATSVTVDARAVDHRLLVEVVDDGIGGADAANGTGLIGLADRVAALGGSLRVESPAGMGTRIVAEIPVA
jgi:signal transduction histidine kinase